MSNYWWWLILSELTGNPILALVLLFVGGWAVDQFTFGILPSPLRLWRRWRRAGQLERELSINTHNRKARFELADLYLEHRRPAKALEVLKPNLAAGDDDPATLYLMGCAAYRSGHPKEAETFLAEAAERDPEFRLGSIYLEQGRGRLARGDAAGAKAALEQFTQRRKGTVEGKVLLARACTRLGELESAAGLRKLAWADYASSPRFVQRQERRWAWTLQPWRPVGLAVAAVCAGAMVAHFAPSLRGMLGGGRRSAALGMLGAMGGPRPAMPPMSAAQQAHLRKFTTPPAHPGGAPIDPKRFVRISVDQVNGGAVLRPRFDPFDRDPAHAKKAMPGDMLCRIWALYGKPDPTDGYFAYGFRDTQTGVIFSAYSAGTGPGYAANASDAQAEAVLGAFDQLLDETQPIDCAWQFDGNEGRYESGVRGGVAYADDK